MRTTRRGARRTLAIAAAVLAPMHAGLSAQTIAITNATIHPVSGPVIPRGTVLIRDGKIAAVGASVSVPSGATVVDATGKHVLPGIVDAMTYYGLAGGDLNETAEPMTPDLDVLSGYTPTGEEFRGGSGAIRPVELLSGGVTTQYIAPADATVIGGQGAVVKTAGASMESVVIVRNATIDMDLGTVAKKTFADKGRGPATRPAVIALVRQALVRAQEYDRAWTTYNARSEADRAKSAPPARNLGNEALVRLLHKEIPARVQVNSEGDIRTALRLADEFGFRIILDGAAMGYKVRELLASKQIPVVVGPTSNPFITNEEIPDRSEYPAPDERNAGWLTHAGVKVAMASFSRTFGSLAGPTTGRWLLQNAAIARGYGMTEDEIIRMVTLTPAEVLGVADRVGSLAPGKDADVVVLDGPPMSMMTWVERTYVNGQLVYQKPASRPGR
jgi:imidazolonepropionase-like amidohydrolase